MPMCSTLSCQLLSLPVQPDLMSFNNPFNSTPSLHHYMSPIPGASTPTPLQYIQSFHFVLIIHLKLNIVSHFQTLFPPS